jgi:hypothetical protein
MERDTLADPKLQHALVRVHFVQKTQACHNAMVEINQLGFGQLIDVNRHCALPT